MGYGCKKKRVVSNGQIPLDQPVPPLKPQPTTASMAKSRFIIRENLSHAPFPLRKPQPPKNDADILMEKFKTFTPLKPT